jgi:isopenicillin N synthase-like dioxygenase
MRAADKVLQDTSTASQLRQIRRTEPPLWLPARAVGIEMVSQKCAQHIPVIELPEGRADSSSSSVVAAARAIDEAASQFGYYSIEDHNVPIDKVLSTIEETRFFFGLPEIEKAAYQASASTQFLGYRRLGAEKSLSHGGAEACEQYRIGNIHAQELDGPAVDPEFFHRPFARSMSLFADMAILGDRLMALAAIAQGEDPGLFAPFFEAPMHRLGLNYYEPGSGERIGNQVSYAMSPHVDRAVFTIVIQNEPGLELLSPGGEWLPAPAGPGALIVFIGDYFQRWTNGRFRASEHRVGEICRKRISIQYKHKPSHATLVEPLAAFVDLGASNVRYEAFDTGRQYERLLKTLLSQ